VRFAAIRQGARAAALSSLMGPGAGAGLRCTVGPGTRAAWSLSYPLPYATQLNKYSAQFGVDKFLLLALIREESSFNPGVESYAHALGLTQIIKSTGRLIAGKLKEKRFKFKDLTSPETAIRFGAFHVHELLDLFLEHEAKTDSSDSPG